MSSALNEYLKIKSCFLISLFDSLALTLLVSALVSDGQCQRRTKRINTESKLMLEDYRSL